MYHVLLRPEAKATQLACKECDYFPGSDGKHQAPSATLIKIRLGSSIWPCKPLAEGWSALPARGNLRPLPGAQITLEDTAGFSPGISPLQKPPASPDSHTRFGEDSTVSAVKGLCPPGSDQVPSPQQGQLCFKGRRILQPMHRFLGTDGVCGLLAMQVMRLWLLPRSFSILTFFLFCSCHHLFMYLCCRIWLFFLLFWLVQGRQMAPPGWWNVIKG